MNPVAEALRRFEQVIGVSVSDESLSAVFVDGHRAVRAASRARSPERELRAELEETIGEVYDRGRGSGIRAWRAAKLKVLASGGDVRVKLIEGIPRGISDTVALAIIRADSSRFIVTTTDCEHLGLSGAGDGAALSAVYHPALVATLLDVSLRAGLSLSFIGVGDSSVEASAMALRAARAGSSEVTAPLVISPRANPWAALRLSTRQVLAVGALSVATGLFAPGLVALHEIRNLEQAAAVSQPAVARAAMARQRLASATSALAQFDRDSHANVSVTHIVAELARLLPEESTIESLRVDSLGGSVTVAGDDAGTAIANFERSSIISTVEITAPIQPLYDPPTTAQRGVPVVGEGGRPNAPTGSRLSIRFRFAPRPLS